MARQERLLHCKEKLHTGWAVARRVDVGQQPSEKESGRISGDHSSPRHAWQLVRHPDRSRSRQHPSRDYRCFGGAIVICPPSAIQDLWARKFPDPVVAFASGWMRVRARARQKGIELPLVISDHADWEALCTTIVETGCSKLLVTHGEADALVHWARGIGIEAEPLHILGYGDEEEAALADAAA